MSLFYIKVYGKSHLFSPRTGRGRVGSSQMYWSDELQFNFNIGKHRKKNIWYTESDLKKVLSELWKVSCYPSGLTLKKLPLLSVRPLGGFLGSVLEAMLSSCPLDWLTLTSSVCVYVWDSVSRGPSSVGQKHTSAVVQPEEIPALATASVTEVLVCWNALSVSLFLLSSCLQHIHLSFSFHFTASSLVNQPLFLPLHLR